MKYDVTQDPEYLLMAETIIGGCEFNRDSCYTIAIFDDEGEFMAVLVYNNWDEKNISMHIASVSPKWATRDSIRTVLSYAFNDLGAQRVSAPCRSSNTKSIDMLERLGFVREADLRKYYATGESELIYGMLKEECRWI